MNESAAQRCQVALDDFDAFTLLADPQNWASTSTAWRTSCSTGASSMSTAWTT